MYSLSGKKLVVAPGYSRLWSAKSSAFVDIGSLKVSETVIFVSDPRELAALAGFHNCQSIHLFPTGDLTEFVREIEDCRIPGDVERWFHSENDLRCPNGYQWAETAEQNGLADLACLLAEIPKFKEDSTVLAASLSMAVLNP